MSFSTLKCSNVLITEPFKSTIQENQHALQFLVASPLHKGPVFCLGMSACYFWHLKQKLVVALKMYKVQSQRMTAAGAAFRTLTRPRSCRLGLAANRTDVFAHFFNSHWSNNLQCSNLQLVRYNATQDFCWYDTKMSGSEIYNIAIKLITTPGNR